MGATQSTESPYVLETPLGSLKGIELSTADSKKPVYRRYTKIPFALPPVGRLRWRRPQPLPTGFSFNDKSGQAGDYTKFGPICPQPQYATSNALLDNPKAAEPIQNVQDEDCLYLNIWVPAGEPPVGGWPVQVYIHGGWLQVGDAMQNHGNDPFDLLLSTETPRIIVAPTYRLNMFGFLAGSTFNELKEDPVVGNYGFWDQRAALEWVSSNISLFNGDKDNITLGGLSAGANSTFFQLYYDAYLPAEKQVIKRVYLWSNAVGIQPNSSTSEAASKQFDELAGQFNIPISLSPAEKLEKLRAVSSKDLVAHIFKLKMHTFRATTDDSFIPSGFLKSIHDGSFAAKLKENGTRLLICEVANEGLLYKIINPPSSKDDLVIQLDNYYPQNVVQALFKVYDIPDSDAPADKWADIFGQIAEDCQVYAVERGLVSSLLNPPDSSKALTTKDVLRCRVAWRAKALDNWLEPKMGVCHAADGPVWWCSGWRADYTDDDKKLVTEFLKPFGSFLKGEEVSWATTAKQIRELTPDGKIEIVEDPKWDRGIQVWNTMRDSQIN